jgi:PIN domain nuclease of toxin-antitoxin system
MNLLLDTQIVIWTFSQDPRLSEVIKDLPRNGENEVFVSAVTAWEISIKKAIGKLKVPGNYREGLKLYRFTSLDITTDHALGVEDLPLHHQDPFDRLLIVQAKLENLTIISSDDKFKLYDVNLIVA